MGRWGDWGLVPISLPTNWKYKTVEKTNLIFVNEKMDNREKITAESIEWQEKEFIELNIGDKRLNERLKTIISGRMQSPNSSIPGSMKTWAKTKGAYRFFSNDKIDAEVIYEAHRNSTIKRIEDRQIILAPQDTTDISYPNHKGKEGIGYITDSEYTKGFFFHPTLAVSPEGVPLGILDSQIWAREDNSFHKTQEEKKKERKKIPIHEKESYKWLKSFNTLCEIEKTNANKFHFVSICDREGDIYELFYEHAKLSNENKPDILVRAKNNRSITDGNEYYLFDELNKHEEFAEYDIIIPRKQGAPSREAVIRVKYKPVIINPSIDLRKRNQYFNIQLYAITTEEINPPKGVKPIQWFLLTTIPILNYADAFEKIEYYRQRWVIEIFFKALKSGCNIENYQLKTIERLKRVLAIDSIIAWRILFLTAIGRECPDLPASVLFEEYEWKALHARIHMTKDVPEEVPKLSVVMRQIGQLGGHLGRKSDGFPGIITLSRGLYELHSISIIWKLLTCG